MFPIQKSPKISYKFFCETCDYKCCKQSEYNKHVLTNKHKILQNPTSSIKTYSCHCGKIYKHSSTLYAHKKTCIVETIIVEPVVSEPFVLNNEFENPENLIKYLMKENAEFKQLLIDQNKQMMGQMVEIAKKTGNNITNNNSFNLNMYLNETCKDALNIMDFVNQLKIGIKDLEETGRLGFADGISKIFINGLKQLDVSNRPVHCSDSKREILYIKNNNEWNKEDDERKVLTSAIKHVVNKNIKQIPEWTKVNPDYNDYHSKQNDKYLQIVMESMSGSSQEEANKNYNKIIKNIAKETVIEKEQYITNN
jgi:hypothetical protein